MQSSMRENNEVIMMDGSVTFETVAMIQKKVMQRIKDNFLFATYTLDLKDVTEVNSAALGLLVELKKYANAHKKVIVFLNLPEKLIALAQVCGVLECLGLSK